MVKKVCTIQRYPGSFVQLLGYIRAYFYLPYRQTEGGGVLKAHAKNNNKLLPSILDYSTISRETSKQTRHQN
jgi:hypothetical protein